MSKVLLLNHLKCHKLACLRLDSVYYEFIGVFVDDITVFSKDPQSVFKTLIDKYKYEFKKICQPTYYNGADIKKDTKIG